jgi:uncharacterized protein (DUF983 family)
MCAERNETKPPLLWSIVTNRCPRCRKGKLFTSNKPYDFRTTMQMPEHCPVCGQRYELQTGFYFGTGYVSYGLSAYLMKTIVYFGAWAFLQQPVCYSSRYFNAWPVLYGLSALSGMMTIGRIATVAAKYLIKS